MGKAWVLGAVMACAVGSGASAATVTRGTNVFIDFDDVPLGSYTSLALGGYVFSSDEGFNIVSGDPTGATANATNVLSLTQEGSLTLRREGNEQFYLKRSALSYIVTNGGPGPQFEYGTDPDGSQVYSGNGGRPNLIEWGEDVRTDQMRIFFWRGAEALSRPGSEGTMAFDDVVIGTVPSVPLPASVWLLGAALAAMGWAAKRRP